MLIFASIYLKHVKTEANKMAPSTDKKEQTFELIKTKVSVDGKEKEVWVPENISIFQQDMSTLVTN